MSVPVDLPYRDKRNLNRALKKLDGLVGLKNIKDEIRSLIALKKLNCKKSPNIPSRVQEIPERQTTVARIVGEKYHALGLLRSGHFIEKPKI